jgi:hypothetical protein
LAVESKLDIACDAGASMRTDSAKLPNIPARHSRPGEALIYWALMRYAIWSHFARVWLRVDGSIPSPAEGPLIFYLNHPS